MPVFSLTRDELRPLTPTTFAEAGLSERSDLQRLLREQIDAIAPGTLVIAEEFGDWEDSRRRIDLLGVDQDANLVVIELKRTEDGGHMELQALRYAAMVSTMTFDQAVEAFERYLRGRGDLTDARTKLLDHLGWTDPGGGAFANDTRIILAAADFSKEVTTTVLWLIGRGLDIRCVRMTPYPNGDHFLLDIQEIIPPPKAEGYMTGVANKEQQGRDARRGASERLTERQDAMLEFWTELLRQAQQRTRLLDSLTPKARVRLQLAATATVGGLRFDYFVGLYEMSAGLEINRPEPESKRIFDRLFAAQRVIETEFGASLKWQRLEGQNRSRVDYVMPCRGVAERGQWPDMIGRLLDAIIRLEAALHPHLDRLTLS